MSFTSSRRNRRFVWGFGTSLALCAGTLTPVLAQSSQDSQNTQSTQKTQQTNQQWGQANQQKDWQSVQDLNLGDKTIVAVHKENNKKTVVQIEDGRVTAKVDDKAVAQDKIQFKDNQIRVMDENNQQIALIDLPAGALQGGNRAAFGTNEAWRQDQSWQDQQRWQQDQRWRDQQGMQDQRWQQDRWNQDQRYQDQRWRDPAQSQRMFRDQYDDRRYQSERFDAQGRPYNQGYFEREQSQQFNPNYSTERYRSEGYRDPYRPDSYDSSRYGTNEWNRSEWENRPRQDRWNDDRYGPRSEMYRSDEYRRGYELRTGEDPQAAMWQRNYGTDRAYTDTNLPRGESRSEGNWMAQRMGQQEFGRDYQTAGRATGGDQSYRDDDRRYGTGEGWTRDEYRAESTRSARTTGMVPMLGADLATADRRDLDDSDRYFQGLRVDRVREGSAAEKAGLRRGDVIVAVDGRSPVTMESLERALNARGEDDIRIRIVRNGNERNLTVDPDQLRARQ